MKKALRSEIDKSERSKLYSATNLPFDTSKSSKIGVKVINDFGDEVLKVDLVPTLAVHSVHSECPVLLLTPPESRCLPCVLEVERFEVVIQALTLPLAVRKAVPAPLSQPVAQVGERA